MGSLIRIHNNSNRPSSLIRTSNLVKISNSARFLNSSSRVEDSNSNKGFPLSRVSPPSRLSTDSGDLHRELHLHHNNLNKLSNSFLPDQKFSSTLRWRMVRGERATDGSPWSCLTRSCRAPLGTSWRSLLAATHSGSPTPGPSSTGSSPTSCSREETLRI